MRGLAGLMMSLLALALALAAAAPGVAGGVGVGVAGGPVTQTGTGSPPVSGPPPSPSLAGPPCAAATAQTLVSVDGNVAERIYRDELVGSGTIADQHQVEENGPLLKALARGGRAGARAAVTEAVHRLVYSHTHIVRLRVLQGGKLLADIGGPYIIAPVGGSLRLHGRVVGTYLLSVQDDLGFVGLEKRLIGMPLILHVGAMRVPLQGTTRTGSVAIPDRGAVVIRGARFQAYSFDAKAFPTGVVRISLLLAEGRGLGAGRGSGAGGGLGAKGGSGAGGGSGAKGGSGAGGGSALSCSAVKVAEVGRIARLIWLRFVLDGTSNSNYVTFTQSHTGALTYLREGVRQVAGSTQPGPPALPESGTVRYRGTTYGVTSFIAQRPGTPTRVPMRVYELVRL
jgi:hypothetical protein